MVGPMLAKLFAMILDKRLSEWAKQHGLRAKGQTWFRKDYRCRNLSLGLATKARAWKVVGQEEA